MRCAVVYGGIGSAFDFGHCAYAMLTKVGFEI